MRPALFLLQSAMLDRPGNFVDTGTSMDNTKLDSTILSPYANCTLCPRECGVNRLTGEKGFCRQSATMRIAFAGLHAGEEPPLARQNGSGTIFFSGCTLACSFCQNCQISHEGMGAEVSIPEFATMCQALADRGAENINLVTGTPFIPSIVLGIQEAKKRGLSIPVVWNTSSWENRQGLELLKDIVDIYLPDIKTFDSTLSARSFSAADYPVVAQKAIRQMLRNAALCCHDHQNQMLHGKEALDAICENPLKNKMIKGVILRHLILPNRLSDTAHILAWYAEQLDGKAILSLMTQYTPIGEQEKLPATRYLEENEYEAVTKLLSDHNIEEGFFQDLLPGSDWLPDFNRSNPFSAALSVPVWHWRDGYLS